MNKINIARLLAVIMVATNITAIAEEEQYELFIGPQEPQISAEEQQNNITLPPAETDLDTKVQDENGLQAEDTAKQDADPSDEQPDIQEDVFTHLDNSILIAPESLEDGSGLYNEIQPSLIEKVQVGDDVFDIMGASSEDIYFDIGKAARLNATSWDGEIPPGEFGDDRGVMGVADGRSEWDNVEAFVRRCYEIMLGRVPDPKGLVDWTTSLVNGDATAAEVISGFIGSVEFQSKKLPNDQLVEILYGTMLDRPSDPEGKRNWIAVLEAGNSYQRIINGFCNSIEFKNLCAKYGITPGSLNINGQPVKNVNRAKIQAFVTRCYNIILGREPDPNGLRDWTDSLAEGRQTASEIVNGFYGSQEFMQKNYDNSTLVELLYRTMLDRPSDPSGKKNWVTILNSGYSYKKIINGFCGSREFTNLCSSYGIKAGSIPESKMAGWYTRNKETYYYDNAGKMVTDWVKLGDVWHYFNANGVHEKTGPVIGSNTGVNLTAMKDRNNDFVAWMQIPGTTVNYPIVRSDNVAHYLDYNFDGKKSKDGTLFSLGKCNWKDLSQNIVVYGHHVEGSGNRMFKSLLQYKNANYFRAHPTINIDSIYMNGRYKIFAVFNVRKDALDPAVTTFGSGAEFMRFVNFAKSNSFYDTGVNVKENDRIITLVTCDRYFKLGVGRLVVMAVKVD